MSPDASPEARISIESLSNLYRISIESLSNLLVGHHGMEEVGHTLAISATCMQVDTPGP